MKALVLGAGGQLGRALLATAPGDAAAAGLSRADCDIGDAAAVAAVLERARPDVVINAAAYTAVDKAETEPEAAERINAAAPGIIARAAAAAGARMVHVSTDFVFDGTASQPYAPGAATSPLGLYGRTKLDGERAAQAALPDALIVRTAWVYAAQGANFVNTMLRVMRERGAVRVVADQVGTPTHATSLAEAIWSLVRAQAAGIHHFTDAGVASWFDFAVAIAEEAAALGLLDRDVSVAPIATSDYPTPAARPAYSVLDKTATWAAIGWTPPHWRVNLRHCLRELQANG